MTLPLAVVLLLAAWWRHRKTSAHGGDRIAVLMLVLAFASTVARLATPGVMRVSRVTRQWVEDNMLQSESGSRPAATGGGEGRSVARPSREGGTGLALHDTYDVRLPHEPRVHVVFPPGPDDTPLRAPRRRLYLRRFGFHNFDGRIWLAGKGTPTLYEDGDDGSRDSRITIPGGRRPTLTYTVVTRYPAAHIPYVPGLSHLNLPAVVRGEDDVYQRPVKVGETGYAFDAASAPLEWNELTAPSPATGNVDSVYLQLPEGAVVDRIRQLAADIGSPQRDGTEAVNQALRYFHRVFTYSPIVRNPKALHPIENFLFEEQRGHCELFASAFVLVLRAGGIPARLAAGYCGGEFDNRNRACTFYKDDAHAWAEILVQDHGWVIADPTPPSSPLAPGAPRQSTRAAPLPLPNVPRLADTIRISPLFGGKGPVAAPVQLPFLLKGSLLLCICAALMLLRLAIVARRTTRSSGQRPHSRPPGFLRAFLRHFRAAGSPMGKGQTLREYLDTLRKRGLIEHEFDDMAHYLYEVSYGGATRDRAFEKALRQRMARLGKA